MMPSAERFLLVQRLYRFLARTSLTLGDVTLLEGACLALAAQRPEGVAAAEAAALLRVSREQLDKATAVLADREQIFWERSPRDRRTFVFRVTAKGADAAALLDEGLAIALIGRSRLLTEAGFDRLVTLLHRCFGEPGAEGWPRPGPSAACPRARSWCWGTFTASVLR